MIYLDVTAACRLPLQTGIPRTTRGLYHLTHTAGVAFEPIVWQPFLFSFTEVSPRARTVLENPFAGQPDPMRAPDDAKFPILKAALTDLLFCGPRRVALSSRLRKDDTLFLTSLFPDNRLEHLRRLRSAPGRKVAIFHDAIPLDDKLSPAWVKERHVAALRVYASMDLVICVSGAAQEELHSWWSKYQIAPNPTQVVTWPVPFTGPRPPFAAPPREKKTVLYVARLKQVKNHETLLAACEILWRDGFRFDLELIGCADEADDTKVVTAAIRRLQAEGRSVRWRGHVSDIELHAAYAASSFTVFPSRREGLGLPILESLWHGRALICSQKRPMADVGRGPGCILVDVETPDGLSTAMRRLLQDEERNLAMAQEAYARPLRTWADYQEELWPVLHLPS